MTAILVLTIVALAALAYIFARSSKEAHQRARQAEAALEATRAEIVAREEDYRALQDKLKDLRSGSPDDRLAASLSGLQDAAARTGAGAARGLAGSSPPARDGN